MLPPVDRTGSSFLPHDLYQYDVIVMSYNYATSEASRLAKFDQQMKEYEQRPSAQKAKSRVALGDLEDGGSTPWPVSCSSRVTPHHPRWRGS